MGFNVGRSIYFSNGLLKNIKIIEEMIDLKQKYAFTSFQIPEASIEFKEVYELLKICRDCNIDIIPDINNETLKKLDLEKLKKSGLNYIRMDEFINRDALEKIVENFNIVVNASTFTKEQYLLLKEIKKDVEILAIHNYYPKEYTGLSKDKVLKVNGFLKSLDIKTFIFIKGDEPLRGPIKSGLVTIEEDRNKSFLEALISSNNLLADVVLIGDPFINENTYRILNNLKNNLIEIKADIPEIFKNIELTDRVDNSEYIFRGVESRRKDFPYFKELSPSLLDKVIGENEGKKLRNIGEVYQSNDLYLRYKGELEIVKKTLPWDERQTYIGKIEDSYINILENLPPFIKIKFI